MNSVEFCYWLQGYFEISQASTVTPDQMNIIKNHLNLVFKHEIDPMREEESNATKEELNHVHNGGHSNDELYRC